jgi:acetyl esterase/lipase
MLHSKKRKPKFTSVCLLAVLLPLCPAVAIQAQNIVVDEGITYAKRGDLELKLDAARPFAPKQSAPVLMFLCGSGWGYYGSDRTQFSSEIRRAARNGYFAITVDYRSTRPVGLDTPKSIFPDQIYDVKCAVRWLYANAEKYNIDCSRIGAVGWSSGANLALMLGLTAPEDGLEGECEYQQYSSKIAAVVNIEGPTDLTRLFKESSIHDVLLKYVGGSPDERPEQYRKASPITYVSRNAPPILTIQGDKDIEVPLQQAEILDNAMKAVGADHRLIIKKNYGHLAFTNEDAMWKFLDECLKSP